MAAPYAIDQFLTGHRPVRVHLETISTVSRRGVAGTKRRWVAEVGKPTAFFSLIGRGRTIRDAIANLGPRAYEMDFDEFAWKTRMVFGMGNPPEPVLKGEEPPPAPFENPDLDEAMRRGLDAARSVDLLRQAARSNVERGWCPCGEELDSECECGFSRLSYVQGKAEPLKRSALHPRLQEARDG